MEGPLMNIEIFSIVLLETIIVFIVFLVKISILISGDLLEYLDFIVFEARFVEEASFVHN